MRQEFAKSARKAIPRLLPGLVKDQSSLMQDHCASAQVQQAGDVVRCHDNDAAPLTFGSQETLQEIDAATVQDAVGLIDQQE